MRLSRHLSTVRTGGRSGRPSQAGRATLQRRAVQNGQSSNGIAVAVVGEGGRAVGAAMEQHGGIRVQRYVMGGDGAMTVSADRRAHTSPRARGATQRRAMPRVPLRAATQRASGTGATARRRARRGRVRVRAAAPSSDALELPHTGSRRRSATSCRSRARCASAVTWRAQH